MMNFDIQRFNDDDPTTDQFGTITNEQTASDSGVTTVTYNDGSVYEYKTGLMSGQKKRQLDETTAKATQNAADIVDIKASIDAAAGYVKDIAYNADGTAIIFKNAKGDTVFTLGEAVADSVNPS